MLLCNPSFSPFLARAYNRTALSFYLSWMTFLLQQAFSPYQEGMLIYQFVFLLSCWD